MLAIKLLFILTSLLGVSMDKDGWVTLERPQKVVPAAEESDPSIWVVFSKQLGAEKILVRFPEDPTYRYLAAEGDELEIVGASQHAEHRLRVLPPQGVEPLDRIYFLDGMWCFEHVVSTPHHTYLFQTKASSMDGISHAKFIASFDVETRRP